VEGRGLVGPDDLRSGGGERDLVRGEVLDERDPAHDHQHQDEPRVQDVEENERERDVQQPEQRAREEHSQREPGVTSVSLSFHRESAFLGG
jgi:hypothetical protein